MTRFRRFTLQFIGNLSHFIEENSGAEKCFHSFDAEMSQPEIKTDSRERILSAAYEMFSRYGIKSVTMDDIAKHLSISKKTIYQSFRDKDEVVHTLLEKQLQNDICDFQAIADNAPNVVEEVFEHMKKLTKMFSNANPNMFYDLRKYHPRTWELVTKFRHETGVNMVEKALEKGKRGGLVRMDCNTKI